MVGIQEPATPGAGAVPEARVSALAHRGVASQVPPPTWPIARVCSALAAPCLVICRRTPLRVRFTEGQEPPWTIVRSWSFLSNMSRVPHTASFFLETFARSRKIRALILHSKNARPSLCLKLTARHRAGSGGPRRNLSTAAAAYARTRLIMDTRGSCARSDCTCRCRLRGGPNHLLEEMF